MSSFVKTDTILDKILTHKMLEIREEAPPAILAHALDAAHKAAPARDFHGALQQEQVALIAEVKKASPSKGVLIEDFDPVAIGTTYAANGAAATSVLTDEKFFQGHLDYMRDVRSAVAVPVLRKDFIIDPYQICTGRAAGADAILLIVAALVDSQLVDLQSLAHELGMAALVEVHNEKEMERALKVGAKLVGINNRNLKTFQVDIETTARLARLVPEDVTLVAESGIQSVADVQRMGTYGARAVLVGESLVKADNIAERVRAFSSQLGDGNDDQS
jgi:indole-3-glycerol phosphate synthase